ncbi:MAG TPA: hypothetical protein VN174_01595 [Candidatus Methanoperedens sp.]|nr:hypothetical protein [Candidatus Methanoperedens sp.]
MNKQKRQNLFLITLVTVFLIIISTLIIFTLKKPTSPNNAQNNNGCIKGGCSGQLCVDEQAGESGISTCEWRDEYECYKYAVCERQKNGKCAFTPNTQFQQCLNKNLPALKKSIN